MKKPYSMHHLSHFLFILFFIAVFYATPFAGAATITTNHVLIDASPPTTISSGTHARVNGSAGANTIKVESGSGVECQNFVGANVLNFDESTSAFTISRSGATVLLKSTAGTDVKIPATKTVQTFNFSNGSHDLVIIHGNILFGSQVVTLTPATIAIPVTKFIEIEFNGNINEANVLSGAYPFLISGALAPGGNYAVDDDYFKFTAKSGDLLTLSIRETGDDFSPSLSLVDTSGFPMAVISHELAYGEAISVRIPADGTYYAVVSEKSNTASANFTYALEGFIDSDMDALSDDFERFMDLNPDNSDSDDDQLSDGIEYSHAAGTPDSDNDGLAAWWDTDADGDGINDFIEGVTDIDLDGLANFIDLDSDGNGINDSVEVGANPSAPVDTDDDSIPDFLDTDNDEDGLLDINDSQMNSKTLQSNLLDTENRVYLISFEVFVTDANDEQHGIRELARAGDQVMISGEGFETGKTVVVLNGVNGPINITPISLTSTAVVFKVPDNTQSGSMTVCVDGVTSNGLYLEIVSSSHPIVYSMAVPGNDIFARPGNTLTISGENLKADTVNVIFTGTTVAVSSYNISDDTITITVPDNAETGDVRVSALGVSNPTALLIRTEVDGQVTLPTSSTLNLSTLEVEFSNSVMPVSSKGLFTLPVLNQGTSSITIFMPSVPGLHDPAVFLSATVIAGDTLVALSPASTAADLVFSAMGLDALIQQNDLKKALQLVETASTDFVTYLNNALGADPYFMEEYTRSDLAAEMLKAIESTAIVLEASIASGEITTVDQKQTAITYSSSGPQVSPSQNQDDFVVTFLGDPINGKVNVENDTMLFADVSIMDTYTGKDIKKFTNAYFSSSLLGPQDGWKALWWGNDAQYDLKFKTADITIRTPGLLEMGSWSEYYNSPSFKLALRSLLSQAVVPVVTTVVGVNYSDTKTELILKVLFDYGVFDGVADYWFSGDFLGGVGAVMKKTIKKHILEDLVEAIVKGIFSADNVQEQIIKLAAKVGLKLTPWGQAATIVQVGGTVVDLGKLATDIVTTRSELKFRAVFPVTIEAIEPIAIMRDGSDKNITLRGQGLAPFNFGTFFVDRYEPTVVFEDADGKNYEETSPRMGSFWVAAGSRAPSEELWCIIPTNWLKDATSPITATLNHHQIDFQQINEVYPVSLEAPSQIKIVDELTLSSITPSKGGPATKATLQGAGFSKKLSENLVFFTGQSGALSATVVSAATDTLGVIVPRGVVTGNVWVEVNGSQSNAVTFTVEEEIYTFTFGDNGAANDDTFALYVDGALVRTMTSPARTVTANVSLSAGQHSVSMRGITAPDDIGTYYITMPSGISVISGDATSGNDMTAGVTKSWVIEPSDGPQISRSGFSSNPTRMIFQAE